MRWTLLAASGDPPDAVPNLAALNVVQNTTQKVSICYAATADLLGHDCAAIMQQAPFAHF